jgi:hypothetical protein
MENLLATTKDITKNAFDSFKRILKTLKISKNIQEALKLNESEEIMKELLNDAINFKCQSIAEEI